MMAVAIEKITNRFTEIMNKNLKVDTIESKREREKDLLVSAYKDAIKELHYAEQNFEKAEDDYIEVAIMELKSKELKVEQLYRELKMKYNLQLCKDVI